MHLPEIFKNGLKIAAQEVAEQWAPIRRHQVLSRMQQHAVPERGQGEENTVVRMQELQLQTTSRFQLHLCQQNYARN